MSLQKYTLWLLPRFFGNSLESLIQSILIFEGFVFVINSSVIVFPQENPQSNFFTPINEPFAKYSAIKELLKRSEDATKEIGQKDALSTFDLGGCIKALPLM